MRPVPQPTSATGPVTSSAKAPRTARSQVDSATEEPLNSLA